MIDNQWLGSPFLTGDIQNTMNRLNDIMEAEKRSFVDSFLSEEDDGRKMASKIDDESSDFNDLLANNDNPQAFLARKRKGTDPFDIPTPN